MITPIQTACYCLIASAVLLMGMLVVTAVPKFENQAKAEMVIAENEFSLMTARTRNNEESLFVLDNRSGLLVVYRVELSRKRFNIVTVENIARVFEGGGGAGGR